MDKFYTFFLQQKDHSVMAVIVKIQNMDVAQMGKIQP